MKRLTFLVFFIVITPAFNALALEVPPKPLGRVSDYTNTLSTSQIRGLDAILEQFEQDTTNQIAVVLIPTLAGDNLEDYSIRLADKWKIGQEGKDNGVILLIVKKERKIRIEVGYGLEGALPDSLAGEIIRERIAPHLHSDDFSEGISSGVSAIIAATKGEYPQYSQSYGGGLSAPVLIAIIIFILGFTITAIKYPHVLEPIAQPLKWILIAYAGGSSRADGFGGGGFGGFSGGGGGFGGGGASGDW